MKLPKGKTCINCIHFDECLSFGATQFKNECLFPKSRFHEQEMEEVFVEVTGNSMKRQQLEQYLETTNRLNYISKNGRIFGIMCSKAGATYIKNGLKNSPQFKGVTKILINHSK